MLTNMKNVCESQDSLILDSPNRTLDKIVPIPNLMSESYFHAKRPNLESRFESVVIHRTSNLESKNHFQEIDESQIRVSNLKIRNITPKLIHLYF